jgi:hypothetical protein
MNPSGSVPEKPESDRTRRRAFLIAGALLVAGAAIALGLAQCDKGPTPPEGKPAVDGGDPRGPFDLWTVYVRKHDVVERPR